MSPRLPPAARRDSIVAAAVPLFARKGFAGTTTREIAEAAGVSEALVFKHFATKTALYDAILESCKAPDPELERLEHLPPSTDTLIEIVWSVTSYFAAMPDEGSRARHRLFLRSLLEDGEFARIALQSFAGCVLPVFGASYDAARASGDVVSASTAEQAFWVVAQMQLMIGSLTLAGVGSEMAATPNSNVHAMLRAVGLRDALIARMPELPTATAPAVAAE